MQGPGGVTAAPRRPRRRPQLRGPQPRDGPQPGPDRRPPLSARGRLARLSSAALPAPHINARFGAQRLHNGGARPTVGHEFMAACPILIYMWCMGRAMCCPGAMAVSVPRWALPSPCCGFFKCYCFPMILSFDGPLCEGCGNGEKRSSAFITEVLSNNFPIWDLLSRTQWLWCVWLISNWGIHEPPPPNRCASSTHGQTRLPNQVVLSCNCTGAQGW